MKSISFNKNNDFIFAISDLHILHKNILLYNFETRNQFLEWKNFDLLKDWNIEDNKILLQDYLNDLSENNKELLDEILINVSRNLIEFMKKKVLKFYDDLIKNNIEQINKLYYIDQWDLFFHLTETKIDLLKSSWLYNDIKNYYTLLKALWFKRLLTLWNHDNYFWTRRNIKQSEWKPSITYDFYNQFFDDIQKYFVFIDDKNNEVQTFSHFPLLSLFHEKTTDKWDKLFLSQDNYFDFSIVEKCYEMYQNNKNIHFIMNYWHVHDRNLINTYIWKKYNKKIDFSDYNVDNFNSEKIKDFDQWKLNNLVHFIDENVELKCNCFDHIYNSNKDYFKHSSKERNA